MSLQIRPVQNGDNVDTRLYSPDRDLAWAFPALAKATVSGLRDRVAEPWLENYIKHTKTTEADIGKACLSFAQAFKLMTSDSQVTSPYEALDRAGFFATPEAAQILVAAKLGQVVVGAAFTSLRAVTPLNGEPPSKPALQALVNEATKLAEQIRNQSVKQRWVKRLKRLFWR